MLIPLHTIIKKHNLSIKGIVHVGAHYAEEHSDYLKNGIEDVVYIEASKASYYHLCRKRFSDSVILFNVALADYEGYAEMYTETANQGQSSSLLKPGTHTKHYPSIKFNQREKVAVTTLDKLAFNRPKYNMLNLDVQGAELLVLKGGKETLQHIDIIYSEVNRDELYEGCAKVSEMDAFLKDFERVETQWVPEGWGDALYIRKIGSRKVVHVPEQYRIKHPQPYPIDNAYEFERWFHDHLIPGDIVGDRHYLPIFWTAYYCKHRYGKDKQALLRLQLFLDKLDRTKKYFTIVQYDDGILNKIDHLDIKIFGMGGGRIDYALPLICEPHKYEFPGIKKDIFCSFIGRITHPIRQTIVDTLTGKRDFYISTKHHSLKDFCEILARSQFVLCPRGYGKTSFRIMEALQYGATPVYISDDFITPHNNLSIRGDYQLHCNNVLLKGKFETRIFEQRTPPTPEENKQLFEKYFTYQSNKQLILENL